MRVSNDVCFLQLELKMPREVVEILLCDIEWFLAGAQFFSTLAYPDQRDRQERRKFEQALVRWTLEWRLEHDAKWREELALIRPGYFSGSDKDHESTIKRGNKRLNERLVAAFYVALPHFRAAESGKMLRRHWIEGLSPTVNNMSQLAALHLGLSIESTSTFKSKMWAPSKPVIHAAAAVHAWQDFYWAKQGRDPNADRKIAMMLLPDMVKEVVEISEELRGMLPQIDQFTIREDETIKFETVQL
jgi:hypothetical protein